MNMSTGESARMLSVAEGARRYLGEDAERSAAFARARRAADGGFRGRGPDSDLYYTVFGVDVLRAAGADVGSADLARYLSAFGNGSALDLIHLACLARGWSRIGFDGAPEGRRNELAREIASRRRRDGSYATTPTAAGGSVYGAFLALGAYDDLGVRVPSLLRTLAGLDRLRSADGAYANEPGLREGTVTATCGALLILERARLRPPADAAEWLRRACYRDGGFVATPGAAVPDLLSTATALYALRRRGEDLSGLREECLVFVESLWHEDGGFSAHWMDETRDLEYTYYGWLAFGCLVEETP
jgi:hypothetical protein